MRSHEISGEVQPGICVDNSWECSNEIAKGPARSGASLRAVAEIEIALRAIWRREVALARHDFSEGGLYTARRPHALEGNLGQILRIGETLFFRGLVCVDSGIPESESRNGSFDRGLSSRPSQSGQHFQREAQSEAKGNDPDV